MLRFLANSQSESRPLTPGDVEIAPLENDASQNVVGESDPPRKKMKSNELANVRCLECHCLGTVMKTMDGIVLFPNKVKKTLLELGGGIFLPNIKKVKPTVKIANSKVKEFVKGFNNYSKDDGKNHGYFQKSLNYLHEFRAWLDNGNSIDSFCRFCFLFLNEPV